jgi:rubredoxin
MVRLNLPFLCPVCGSDGFQQVIVKRPDGVTRTTEAWECRGCSTMFRDADRFTVHRPIVQRKSAQ